MVALSVWIGTVLFLVAFDEVARARWTNQRFGFLKSLGALPKCKRP